MSKAYWIQGPSRMGWTCVYVVDEHGCLLNTEPACSVPDRYGDWFLTWLLQQKCPYPVEGPFSLLHHDPSFPAPTPCTCRDASSACGSCLALAPRGGLTCSE